jgi:site-specific recombinase XerC
LEALPVDIPIPALEHSFERYLRATNRSPRTVKTYLCALRAFSGFLVASSLPSGCRSVRRAHIEAFVAGRLSLVKAATVSVQFRALQQFCKWAVEEGEVTSSPMSRIRAPIVYVRLKLLQELGYELALVWPEYEDPRVNDVDGLKLSPQKLASIKRFVEGR